MLLLGVTRRYLLLPQTTCCLSTARILMRYPEALTRDASADAASLRQRWHVLRCQQRRGTAAKATA